MRIGFVGLGKLGLPCALAIEAKGHEVRGVETSESVREDIMARKIRYREAGAGALLRHSDIKLVKVDALVAWAEIIFVAVQTPHAPEFEGVTRLPAERQDFDYTHLKNAIIDIKQGVMAIDQDRIVVVISTVLPGTIDREIVPMLGSRIKLCYNPFFIAMGTCIRDFLEPEFVLLGVDDQGAADKLTEFYATLHDRFVYRTGIREAEAIKVFYNTFISTKLAFVNSIMEVCEKMNIDVDAVTDALKMGTDRIVSPAYMTAGMGDGGGCHPRDNIALSWLARELNMRMDWFQSIMHAREAQTEWFASLILGVENQGPIVILGKAFKAESNITTGSPAILLRNLLVEWGYEVQMYDPHVDEPQVNALPPNFQRGTIFFIGTKHPEFAEPGYFPQDSIVIDPWRYIPEQDGVRVMRLGEGRNEVGVS